MKLAKFLLLFLFFASACTAPAPSTHRYPLAICAIFKNEAPWLKEWISYHHNVLKVDRFYLYNNESTDHFAEVLQPFIDTGIVELIDWDSKDPDHRATGDFMDAPWSAAQLGAYNDCLKKRALGKARWVAMIDIDEFIVPATGVRKFYDLLNGYEKKGKGSLSFYWRVFGTSDVETLPEKESLIEKLVWRSDDTHPWNKQVKSIHRPEAVDFCLVHIAAKLYPGFGSKTIPADQTCINHYWTRTAASCFEKRKMSKELDPKFFADLHRVKDESILQYLHGLQ